nr:uncharacterized protein LOC100178441 isoform X1 [Ciona intestinalis]|eukprot:XP_009857892.1 uncharacterized protein LOC100178441 isoform X1 [Ciona intestinalis]
MENTISSRVSIVSDEPEELSKTLDSDSATRSLCSSPYSQKLLTLSPRTSKGNYKFNLSPDFRIASSGETGLGATICSGESSSSSNDSGYLTTPIEMHTQFDFHRKPSMETESNADDIDFFLQVVGVFRDYIADQICILESRFKENKQNLDVLQGQLKANENVASQQETQLVRDFSNLISLLHQKQSELQRLLKRQSVEVGEKIRGQSDICRGNIKMVSGILNFAKRLRNESGESMRENAVREFKQRLLSANDLPTADLNIASDSPSRINLEAISKLIQNIQFQSVRGKELKVERNGTTTNDKCNKCKMIPPAILAAQSDDDITKTSLTVRWTCCANCESEYGLKWSYKLKIRQLKKVKKM